MPRLDNAIIGSKAYGRSTQAPVLDLRYGGMNGFAPDLKQWVSNAAYIRKNLIPILVEAPRAFRLMPDSALWIGALRALIELHPTTIDGLNMGLDVEVVDHAVGGGGQRQDEFVNVTEQRSNPTFTWTEKYGMPITRFIRNWITYCMMEPNSKVAGITTLTGARPQDMLPDMYTMTVAFIEPDPHHNKVMKSWLVTNMFPRRTGDIIGRREMQAGSELTTLNIEFGGIAQMGLGVDAFCQSLLDSIDITGASPYHRQAFIQRQDQDVVAAPSSYERGAEDVGRENVDPTFR